MIKSTNRQINKSIDALQEIAATDLRGTYALQLKDILEPVQKRINRLGELEIDSEEEWEEVIYSTLGVEEDKIPREALQGVEISAGALVTLDWPIE